MLWSGRASKQDMPYAYKRNSEVRSCDHCCRGKAIRVTYFVCVSVALVTQRTKHRRRVILPSVASPATYHIYPHYLINGTIFGKVFFNINWLFRFSVPVLSKTFLFLRRAEGDTITTAHRSSCKVAGIIVRF